MLAPASLVPSYDVGPRVLESGAQFLNVTWDLKEKVNGYVLMMNNVQVYRDTHNWTLIANLERNKTYYFQVAALGDDGVEGYFSPITEIPTLS